MSTGIASPVEFSTLFSWMTVCEEANTLTKIQFMKNHSEKNKMKKTVKILRVFVFSRKWKCKEYETSKEAREKIYDHSSVCHLVCGGMGNLEHHISYFYSRCHSFIHPSIHPPTIQTPMYRKNACVLFVG